MKILSNAIATLSSVKSLFAKKPELTLQEEIEKILSTMNFIVDKGIANQILHILKKDETGIMVLKNGIGEMVTINRHWHINMIIRYLDRDTCITRRAENNSPFNKKRLNTTTWLN